MQNTRRRRINSLKLKNQHKLQQQIEILNFGRNITSYLITSSIGALNALDLSYKITNSRYFNQNYYDVEAFLNHDKLNNRSVTSVGGQNNLPV